MAVSKTSFKANSKALAEKEGEGIAKLIYRCASPPSPIGLLPHIQQLSLLQSLPCLDAARLGRV